MRDDEIIISVLEHMGMSDHELYIELGKKLEQFHDNSFDYLARGKEFWYAAQEKLRLHLCDQNTKTPKSSVLELVSIDGRELMMAILPLITEETGKEITVAIPVLALLLKNGLVNLCS